MVCFPVCRAVGSQLAGLYGCGGHGEIVGNTCASLKTSACTVWSKWEVSRPQRNCLSKAQGSRGSLPCLPPLYLPPLFATVIVF